MCPANFINSADGSTSCPSAIPSGTNLTERNAVIVSFGVFFNGTALSEIAGLVGVQASPSLVLSTLVRYCSFLRYNVEVPSRLLVSWYITFSKFTQMHVPPINSGLGIHACIWGIMKARPSLPMA